MKKQWYLWLVVCAMLVLTSCGAAGNTGSDVAGQESQQGDMSAVGGNDPEMVFACQYQLRLYSFPAELFRNTCGEEAFYAWVDTFNRDETNPDSSKRPYNDCNLFTFVEDFQVSKQDFIRYMKEGQAAVEPIFSDDELALICEGSQAQRNAAFVNPSAILVGDTIYAPYWIATHSAQELAAAGITPAMLNEKSAVWEKGLTEGQITTLTQAKTALQAAERAELQ